MNRTPRSDKPTRHETLAAKVPRCLGSSSPYIDVRRGRLVADVLQLRCGSLHPKRELERADSSLERRVVVR